MSMCVKEKRDELRWMQEYAVKTAGAMIFA